MTGTDSPQVMARAVEVTRHFGDVAALDGVSLDVPAGQLVGLLGPNGAGKTTLLSLLTGLRRPTAGRVELFGGDPRDALRRRSLGSTPQETGLPATLRVGEVVDFVSRHYRDPLPAAELLGRFGLDGLQRRQTGGLSGGQRRRLAVALAFVGRPRLVILDEPTTGLDIDARRTLWDGVRSFHRDGGTVLLTSHYLEEVEALAERVVVVDRGRVVIDDTLDAVRASVDLRRVSLSSERPPDLAGVVRVESEGTRHHLFTPDADALVRDLVLAGATFSDLEVRGTSLEEAFLALTGTGVTTGTAAPPGAADAECATGARS